MRLLKTLGTFIKLDWMIQIFSKKKNAWTLVRQASDNEGTLGRDPIMQRQRDLIKGNNAL